MATLDRLFDSMRFDVTLSLAEASSFAQVERALGPKSGVTGAEGWLTLEASLTPPPADGAEDSCDPVVPERAGCGMVRTRRATVRRARPSGWWPCPRTRGC